MAKHLCLLCYLLVASCPSIAEILEFNKAGFSIHALEAPPHLSGSQPLTMLLPYEQGFSANVNVQIQYFEGNLVEYKALSQSQFNKLGFKIIREIINHNSLFLEYSGEIKGRHLHWYAKAIKRGKFVYLATATSLEKNWLQNKFELVKSVDSFSLK